MSNVIAFMQQARAPKPYGPLNGAFTQITTMSAAFTSVSGMNQVPTTTGGVLVRDGCGIDTMALSTYTKAAMENPHDGRFK